MNSNSTPKTSAQYRPGLAWFAALGSAWVFVLVMLGAFTTTIGAGMAFADWPLSNGSVNPHGWLEDVAMFAEHSHRLSGAMMGLITLGLAIWLQRVEDRSWVRKLGWAAVSVVIIQGIIGGQRVRLDGWYIPGVEMSVGQILRIPHGVLAQVFIMILFAIAAAVSRTWTQAPAQTFTTTARVRRLGLWATGLVLVQLVIAATMRHHHAGLAIPTFPLTPDGGVWPSHWNFHVGIHFAHRAMAAVLTVIMPIFAVAVWRSNATSAPLRLTAGAMFGLLFLQISLGAAVIWTVRDSYWTTAHVLVGALTLATTFLLTWWSYRNGIEDVAEVRLSATEPRPSSVRPSKVSSV